MPLLWGLPLLLSACACGNATTALEQLDPSSVADAAERERSARLRAARRAARTHLDMLFVAKSFERIGDHATNVFEHVIYAVKGDDLRHSPPFSS